MKTLVKDCYIWQWDDETVENLKKKNFRHFNGHFVKRDFLINENNKILVNFNVENEKIDKVVCLKDKYCVPGFIDAHMHLAMTSELNGMCNLDFCKSVEDVVKALQEFEKKKEKEKMEDQITNCTNDDDHHSSKTHDYLFGAGYKALSDEVEEHVCEQTKKKEVKIDRFILDKYFPNKCVVILSTCLHYAMLNSKALEHFGLLLYEREEVERHVNIQYCDKEQEEKEEEEVQDADRNNENKKKKKKITGVVYEQTVQDVYFKMVNECLSEADKMKNIKSEVNNLVKTGLTCIQTCDKHMAPIYKKLEDQNNLHIRTLLIEFSSSVFDYLFNHYKLKKQEKSDMELYMELLQVAEKDEHRNEVEKKLKEQLCMDSDEEDTGKNENNIHQTNRLFRGNRIKFFCDGSLGGKTCATYFPFQCTDITTEESSKEVNKGKTKRVETNFGLLIDPLTLSSRIKISKLFNFRIEFHCIGDRSADFLLNELLHINKNHDRFIIVHAQLVNESVIEKMKNLNILLSCQPSFLSSDFKYIQNYIHSSYKKYCYLYKSLLNKNIIIAGSSDAPVELFSPIIGIFDCMFRSITKVLPLSYIESFFTGSTLVQKKKELDKNIQNIKSIIDNCYEKDERLSFPEALAIYTITAAYLAKAEFFNEANKIKLGAICDYAEADFVVFDRDISKDCEINLLSCRICQTWVGGQIRYENEKITQ